MSRMDKLAKQVIESVRTVCSYLLLVMLGIVFVDVFARYVCNRPIVWSEEITLMLLIWFGFFSISNELYYENHMAILMLFHKYSPRLKKIVSLVNIALLCFFFVVMMCNLLRIALVISASKLPVSGLPKVMLYIPVICSSALMIFYSVALFIRKLHRDYTAEEGEKNE